MEKTRIQLENLPNELFFYLFKYFNSQDLFRIFNNLNSRFNSLIKSVHHLSLSIKTNNSNIEENFQFYFPYIYKLHIGQDVSINLNQFLQLHHLILNHPIDTLLTQLITHEFPYLEKLIITDRSLTLNMSHIHQKIFSNGFSSLHSFISFAAIQTIDGWTQSSTLRILKIGYIELSIYKAILSTCPNLYFLRLTLPFTLELLSNVKPHENLKRIVLNIPYNTKFANNIYSKYLQHTPNLEQLTINGMYVIRINKDVLLDNDWFSSIITDYLPLLQRFTFKLELCNLNGEIKSEIENLSKRLEEDFMNIHKGQYQTRFIIVKKLVH